VRLRRLLIPAIVLAIIGGVFYASTPYVRAAALIARGANLGGRVERLADAQARTVTTQPRQMVPTRYGDVPVQFYVPEGSIDRTVLLIPGIHSMGIEEPRLTALAADLAGSGVRVMAMALPDLQAYRITPRATDVIEDAVKWAAGREDLAPDGKVGIVGISFAGGLSISASGRESIRDKVAFIVSFGGHGDLPRVMKYLATGKAAEAPGVIPPPPPHDYGVAVILYGLADRGVVPAEQVDQLRDGIRTFLLASQQTLVSMDLANANFAKAREMATAMPEPARTFMGYVNDRAVDKLGPALVPFLNQLGADDPALSPQRASPPAAPIYLLHGDHDTVIPAPESAILANALKSRDVDVTLLLSGLITHAEVNKAAAASEMWKLVSFWADVLRQ
jgi:dienelactone hydrolase